MNKEAIELLNTITKVGMDKDPYVMALFFSVARNPEAGNKEKLLRILKPKVVEHALFGDPLMPYPGQDSFNGEIIFGKVGVHQPYTREQLIQGPTNTILAKCMKNIFTKHLLAVAATGQGKTTLAYQLIFEFKKIGLNFISISFKRDIRHLIRHIPNLLVFRIGPNTNFKWNIFKGYPSISTLCRIFSETLNLGIGAESMLYDFSMKLLRQGRLNIANLYHEISEAKFKVFRDVNWKASLCNRLLPFKDIFWKLLNTEAGLALHKLQENFSIDFEVDQSGEYRSFWSTIIPQALYEYRIENNLRGQELIIPLFIDEALSVASKAIQHASYLGDPTLFSLFRLGREFGMGFNFFTTQPTALSDTVKANTAIKILMNSGRFEETFDTARSMHLTEDVMDFATGLLPGQSIMQIETIKPTPVTFPEFLFSKDVTNEEIDEHNAGLLRGTEFEYLIKPEPEPVIMELTEAFTNEEKILLSDIYNRPFLTISERKETVTL